MSELVFKGKEFVYNHHLTVPYRPLVTHPKKSIGRKSENLVIHGDNLHGLKALLPRYAGKVDLIFIDPPYNTGNEGWKYNDNVNSPMILEWLGKEVGLEDLLRHDKWCCMMWPRLKLLHDLLADSGSIWMTIDDNECHRLRSMMDAIFGDQNHVATVAWQKRTSPEARLILGPAHDYVVVYAKDTSALHLNRLAVTAADEERFENPDGDLRGPWVSTDFTAQGHRKNQMYKITTPSGKEYNPPPGRCWSMVEPAYLKLRKEGRLYFGVDGSARPRIKTYLEEVEGLSDWTWWPHQIVGHNQEAKKEIIEILGDPNAFQTPKPTRLLKRILALATSKNSIVLDSFAGSGTTGHAVLALNKSDNGTRKFILVECEDYADNVTAERIRRVIKGYPFMGTKREELHRERLSYSSLSKAGEIVERVKGIENLEGHRFTRIKKELIDHDLVIVGESEIEERVEGLGGSFTYFTLGEPVDMDALLTGRQLPAYEAIGAWLFHTATGETLEPESISTPDNSLGESSAYHVWLYYKPDMDWLRSKDAALTLSRAEELSKGKAAKPHLVFAPACYVPNAKLRALRIDFAPLPFALYRVDKG